MNIFILFFLSFVFAGEIVCNLCKDTIGVIEDLIIKDGANSAKEYIDNICLKTSGFLNTMCEKLLDFGIDEIVKLIENHVDAMEICTKIKAC